MIIRINKKSARSNSADAPPDPPLIARVKAERRFTRRYISSSAGGLNISIFPFSFFCVPAAAPFLLLVGCCLQLRGSWQLFSSVPSLPKEKKKKKKVEVEKKEEEEEKEDPLKKKAGTAFRSVGDGCDELIGTRGNVECRCDENLCWRRSYKKVCAAVVDESNAPLPDRTLTEIFPLS